LDLLHGAPLNYSTHRKLANIFAKLAMGAYTCGKIVHAKQFIEQARNSFKEIFDELPNFETAYAALGILTYYLIAKEKKTERLPYETLLLQDYENIDDSNLKQQKMEFLELKSTALLIRTYFTSPGGDINQIVADFKNLGNNSGRLYGEIIYAEEILRSGTTFQAFSQALQHLKEAEKILFSEKKNYHTLKFVRFLAWIKAIESGLHLAMGNTQSAITVANDATLLFHQMLEITDNSSFWFQYRLMEWPGKVHYITRCTDMLTKDLEALEKLKNCHLFDQSGADLLNTLKTRHYLLKNNEIPKYYNL